MLIFMPGQEDIEVTGELIAGLSTFLSLSKILIKQNLSRFFHTYHVSIYNIII